MPEPIKPSGSKSPDKTQEDEIQRLRAQVSELQSELSRRPLRASSPTAGQEEGREPSGREDSYGKNYSVRNDDSVDENDLGGRAYDMLDESSDAMRELPARAMDEASKLVRSLTFAYLEELRMAASVLNTFVNEVSAQNQPERGAGGRSYDRDDERSRSRRGRYSEDEARGSEGRGQRRRSSGGHQTVRGLAADLPRSMHSGVIQALHHATTIPSRVVETFYGSYRESAEAEPSTPVRGAASRARDDRSFDRDTARESDSEQEIERAKREASRAVRESARATLEAAKPNP